MGKKRCVACGTYFQTRPHVPHQTYCSASVCQRERRQAWQRYKLQSDPDHRDNKSRAQQSWAQKNPDYWRNYRKSHPQYVERNRSMQRERNATRERDTIAKKDASIAEFPPPPGVYRIRLVAAGEIAKTDVCTIEITMHTCQCTSPGTIAKIGRDP